MNTLGEVAAHDRRTKRSALVNHNPHTENKVFAVDKQPHEGIRSFYDVFDGEGRPVANIDFSRGDFHGVHETDLLAIVMHRLLSKERSNAYEVHAIRSLSEAARFLNLSRDEQTQSTKE